MITAIVLTILLLVTFGILSLTLGIFGGIFKLIFWLCLELPLSIALFAIGIAFCCTILLIPLGVLLIQWASALIIPG